MPDTHEFGSPSWLVATCDLAEKTIAEAGADLTGVTFAFGEEFTNVPARLNPTGVERPGWHVAIRDGVVTTAPERPPADADSITVAD